MSLIKSLANKSLSEKEKKVLEVLEKSCSQRVSAGKGGREEGGGWGEGGLGQWGVGTFPLPP